MNAKSHIDLNAREKSEASSTNIVRNAVSFKSGGEILHGWLYLPSKILPGKRLPAIAAANAMTAVKEINLPEYAERFAKAGFATIIIGGFGISLGGEHMLFLATWEPRLKAVVAVSTGISPQRESELLTEEEAKDRYRKLLSASEAERAGRPSAKITTMQAWCPEPTEGCALPVKEAYDFWRRMWYR